MDANVQDQQIAQENADILNAAQIPVSALTGMIGRCSWCGQPSQNLNYVDSLHGIDRYKCAERCNGF